MSFSRNLAVAILVICVYPMYVWGDGDVEKPLAEAIREEGGSIFCVRKPRFHESAYVEKDGASLVGFWIGDICRLDVATGAVDVLTKKPLPVCEISPAPDGRAVAFLSKGDKTSDIFVLNCHTKQITNLTKGAGNSLLPTWSPNGKQIAFASDRAGDWRVYVMSTDGSGVQQVGAWNAKNVTQELALPAASICWEVISLHWMSDASRLLVKLEIGPAKQREGEGFPVKYVGRIVMLGKGDMQEGAVPPPRDGALSHDGMWFVTSYWGPSRHWRNPSSIGADWRTTALFVQKTDAPATRRLLYDGGSRVHCSAPAWSPSDSFVVFEWGEEHGSLEPLLKRGDTEHPWITEISLGVVSLRNGSFLRLTKVQEYDWREPRWVRGSE